VNRSPWNAEGFELRNVPTMLSREERDYLHWLGRTQWQDAGHVVEIGPWLGGSTVCLADGMHAGHANARHRLHAFDNFIWREFMAEHAQFGLKPGDSFEPQFRANVARYGELVVAHAMALPDEVIPGDKVAAERRSTEHDAVAPFRWDREQAIEILFVDGAKAWRGMRYLMLEVAESLLPGRSLLVAQDFKHWGAYWVPLMLARLRDKLEFAHDTLRGSTVTFRLTRALDRAAIEAMEDDVANIATQQALAELEAMARYLSEHGDAFGGWQTRLGGVRLLAHQNRLPEAVELFARLQDEWPVRGSRGPLDGARRYLSSRGIANLPAPKPAALRWLRSLVSGA
jgi:hypothetical protein